jgi:hypothetical protein
VDRTGIPVETFPKPFRFCDTFVLPLDVEGDSKQLDFLEKESVHHRNGDSPIEKLEITRNLAILGAIRP